MKIGILQCDDVAKPLLPAHGNYPDMLRRLLGTVDPQLQFSVWACHEGDIPDPDTPVDGWVTTGSKASANDTTPWIGALGDLLCELHARRRPLIGVCFGHQLLARALGGAVGRNPGGWGIGVSHNRVDVTQPWMHPLKGDTLDLVVSHQEQVTRAPAGAVVLASSAFCPVYMMQMGPTTLGIQGHPEFTRAYAADLMRKRRERFAATHFDEAMHSLDRPADSLQVAQWMVNFVRQQGHRK